MESFCAKSNPSPADISNCVIINTGRPWAFCVSGITHYGGVKFFKDGDLANSPQQEFSPNSRPQIGT